VIPPLRLSFEVDCGVATAFELWTARIDVWWPRGHTVSGDDGSQVVLEPGVGGRVFERTPSGEEIDWGEVTVWEPPHRLAYLWHLKRDRTQATDVEVRFVESDRRTLVEIEHGGWERLGPEGPVWRERNHSGWSGVLEHYEKACHGAR
jgi:uncharacterized protein YndB with AHSA1/START domain